MKTISRLFKHLTTTTATGKRAFPDGTLKAIEEAIAEGEKQHRAEVRMVIEPSLSAQAILNGTSSRDRAKELFSDYGVWDTEENCGVLVYVNLADHQVEIVADRGVSRVVGTDQWEAVCRTMTQAFAKGAYHDGVITALDQLNTLLIQHYPDIGVTQNQLSNKPMML